MINTIEFAGMYIAERDGLYAGQGIDIELRSAFDADGNFVAAIPAVMSGQADFGVASSYDLVNDHPHKEGGL